MLQEKKYSTEPCKTPSPRHFCFITSMIWSTQCLTRHHSHSCAWSTMNGSCILHNRLVVHVCCSTLVIGLQVVHYTEIVISYYLGDGISSSSIYSNNNAQFSTFDNDNDASFTTNNAVTWRGAWWYHNGHTSNLNGEYGNNNHGQGINWFYFKGWTNSLSGTRMMLRMP